MSDDLSKPHRIQGTLADGDPTDCSPISDVRNDGASQDGAQLGDAALNRISATLNKAMGPTEPNRTSVDTEVTLARQTRVIADLRRLIGTMSSEIERLNSLIVQTPEPAATIAPPKTSTIAPPKTLGSVNRILVVLNGSQKLKYPLFKASMTIGRSPENDIQIATEYVSRVHARITSNETGAAIEDLNSRNGVVVNSNKVGRKQLRNGDLVALGKMQFKFIDLMEADSGEGQA